MSIYGLGVIVSPALGPVIGGFLVDAYSWRAIFFVTMPLCVAALVMGKRYLPGRDPSGVRPAFDWGGFALLLSFLASLFGSFSLGHSFGWRSAPFLALFGIEIVAGVAFVMRQLRAPHPLLDLALFRDRAFSAASIVTFAYGLGLYGSIYVIPLFSQTVARYSATESGMLLLPGGLVLALTIFLSGRLTDRFSSHYVVMTGLACFALSFLLFSFGDATTSFVALATWIVIGRIGLGAMIPSLSAGAMQAVPYELVHQGSGAINFIRQLGGAVGINLIALVLEWRIDVHGLAAAPESARVLAFQDGFLALAIVFLLAIIPAHFMRRNPAARPPIEEL